MNFFALRDLEVAGGWGPGTVVSAQTLLNSLAGPIPNVVELEYKFQDWIGDALIETHSCYVVTKDLADALRASGITGVRFAFVKVTTDIQFAQLREWHGASPELPAFEWMIPEGYAEMRGNILTKWSGHDICFGIRTDWVRRKMTPEDMKRNLPPDELIVSSRALGVLQRFQVDSCTIVELSTQLAS